MTALSTIHRTALLLVAASALLGICTGQTVASFALRSRAQPQSTSSNCQSCTQYRWQQTDSLDAADGNVAISSIDRNNQYTELLEITDFNFTLTDAAVITGLLVQITRSSTPEIHDFQLALIINGNANWNTDYCNVPTVNCNNNVWASGVNAGRMDSFGGATFLWNYTLIPQTFDSNFGIALRAKKANGGSTSSAYVDYVSMTVYYLTPEQVAANQAASQASSSNGGGGNGGAIAAGILVPLIVIGIVVGVILFLKFRKPEVLDRAKSSIVSTASKVKQQTLKKEEEQVSASSTNGNNSGNNSLNNSNHVSNKVETPEPATTHESPPPTPKQYTPKTMRKMEASPLTEQPPPQSPPQSPPQPSLIESSFLTTSLQSSSMQPKGPLPDRANYQKSGNPYGENVVYGVPLQHVRKTGEVPCIVEDAVAFLTEKALYEEGILRLAGSNSEIKRIKEEYNAGKSPNLSTFSDIHSVGGALKLYFRELPQKPLLMTNGLKQASTTEDESEAVEIVKDELNYIPEENYYALRRLFLFLSDIASVSDYNKMTADNLAIVFHPTLNIPMNLIVLFINHPEIFS